MAPSIRLLVLICLPIIEPEALLVSESSGVAADVVARLAERASAGTSFKSSKPLGVDAAPGSDDEFESDLLEMLEQPEPSKVAAVLSQGLEAITLGIAPFLRDPPDWKEGLDVLNAQFWEVVLLLVPKQHHQSSGLLRSKDAWNRAFVRTPEIAGNLTEFKSSGDANALTQGVKSILYLAVEMFSDVLAISRVAPKIAEYFDAIVDLIDGVSASWELHAEGHIAQATEAVWKAVKIAVDDVTPEKITNHQTYSLVMGTVDGVMGRLTEHVLDYQRRTRNSKVCYKRTIARERKRPSSCRKGFEWDQMHTCYPSASNGAACLRPCGGAGMCPSFCGANRACCRRGDKKAPVECKGSTGFVDFAYTKGSSKDYHQCVQPGPAVAFKIKSCGEFDLNGLWVRTGVKFGRPRYTLIDNQKAKMNWSEKQMAWRLHIGRRTLYIAASNSTTFPTSGWQAVDGISPVPQVETLGQLASPSLVQVGALEGSLARKRKAAFGTHEAACNTDEEDVEKVGHWCLSPCPPGYRVKNAHTCVQLCGGNMPADSWGMCGQSPAEVHAVVAQTAAMVSNGALKSYILIDGMRKDGVDGDSLAGTINTFVDMGKPFAHPKCPEFVDA